MFAMGVEAPIGPPVMRALTKCPHLLNPREAEQDPERRGLLPTPFGASAAYTMPAGTPRTIPSSTRVVWHCPSGCRGPRRRIGGGPPASAARPRLPAPDALPCYASP